jgi:hypothetical protein
MCAQTTVEVTTTIMVPLIALFTGTTCSAFTTMVQVVMSPRAHRRPRNTIPTRQSVFADVARAVSLARALFQAAPIRAH